MPIFCYLLSMICPHPLLSADKQHWFIIKFQIRELVFPSFFLSFYFSDMFLVYWYWLSTSGYISENKDVTLCAMENWYLWIHIMISQESGKVVICHASTPTLLVFIGTFDTHDIDRFGWVTRLGFLMDITQLTLFTIARSS